MLPLPPWAQGHRYRWNVHHAFGHGRHAGGHCRRWEGMMTSKSMTLVLAGAESSRCMDGRCLSESAGGSVNLRFLEPRKWDRTRMNKNWWICGTWSWASKCNTCHVNCLLFPLMIWYIMIFIYIYIIYVYILLFQLIFFWSFKILFFTMSWGSRAMWVPQHGDHRSESEFSGFVGLHSFWHMLVGIISGDHRNWE